jgi:hypothetical protein
MGFLGEKVVQCRMFEEKLLVDTNVEKYSYKNNL